MINTRNCRKIEISNQSMMEDVLSLAASRIGFPLLKDKQVEVVRKFMSKKDVFICLPTGFGKSVCYMILPFVFDLLNGNEVDHHALDASPSTSLPSIVVVIPLLKSLMLDQVQSCNNKGIKAVYICADDEEARQCYHSVLNGEYQVVYIHKSRACNW